MLVPLFWVMALMPSPALAHDRGVIDIDQDNRVYDEDLPPFTTPATSAVLCAQVNPDFCAGAGATYCDRFLLNIHVDEGYREVFEVSVTVDWEGENNDLQLYFWALDDEGVFCPTRDIEAGKRPRRMAVVEPESMSFWVVVINRTGINTGYNLRVEWAELDISFTAPDQPDRFARPTSGSDVFTAPVSSGFRPDSTVPRPRGDDRSRTILVPGPDGELEERELQVLARGDREPPPTRLFDPVVVLFVGVMLMSGVVVAFLGIRKRRAEL